MSEKMYYVFLSPLNNGNKPFFQLISHGFMGELVSFTKCNTKNKDGRYENKYSRFTKSELAEIMGGALYRLPVIQYNSGRICPNEEIESDTMGKFGQITRYPEWINPLIELVPVEDGE
ncbi:hypothetical protein [Lactococcus cremoris]|uniref:hypothetical protein n=1 Tax=Lactococcus lactis subsp. cremoris TaxID=1359 RepID=UPI0003ABB238|nr:hypothetical protein [Lactococcus cremoris]AGV73771.1 phage-related protein [Lactococcus cremoris subsp. cremoris KW2]